MCTTEPLNFSPPEDLADIMKKKLQSGDNASESEIIRDGLRAIRRSKAGWCNRWHPLGTCSRRTRLAR